MEQCDEISWFVHENTETDIIEKYLSIFYVSLIVIATFVLKLS